MFGARPPAGPHPPRDFSLVRAARGSFAGPAEFLADPANRARVGEYVADMARPYGREVHPGIFGEPRSAAAGHSYGEMAKPLIGQVVSAGETVDLLVLAFSVHDLRPGRQTAAYLSGITPGAPLAFAICDQGSAAAFSALRIARDYASTAGIRRALLIVVEQGDLPYDCPAALPAQHRGVAMLFGDCAQPRATLTSLSQHPDVPPARVAELAEAELRRLVPGQGEVGLVVSSALGRLWAEPAAGRVRVMPAGQPATDVWWGLIDELADGPDRPGLVVVADYDPALRYLCLTSFGTTAAGPGELDRHPAVG
jgi:hypothetical protein